MAVELLDEVHAGLLVPLAVLGLVLVGARTRDALARGRRAVHDEVPVADLDRVPAHADDPLDEVVVARVPGRREQDHDVAALGGRPGRLRGGRERQPRAVRPLLDDDVVADEQRRDHGPRGDEDRLVQERPEREDREDGEGPALQLLDQLRPIHASRAPFRRSRPDRAVGGGRAGAIARRARGGDGAYHGADGGKGTGSGGRNRTARATNRTAHHRDAVRRPHRSPPTPRHRTIATGRPVGNHLHARRQGGGRGLARRRRRRASRARAPGPWRHGW